MIPMAEWTLQKEALRFREQVDNICVSLLQFMFSSNFDKDSFEFGLIDSYFNILNAKEKKRKSKLGLNLFTTLMQFWQRYIFSLFFPTIYWIYQWNHFSSLCCSTNEYIELTWVVLMLFELRQIAQPTFKLFKKQHQ